jgi:hypothetical protein
MGYYQGDYYAGARGDPFWGSLIGVAKRVGGALLGGSFGGGKAKPVLSSIPAAMGGIQAAGRAIIKRGGQAIIKHPVLSAAGAAGVGGMVAGAAGEALMTGGGGGHVRGFHLCKSKHGCKSGQWVRNRHMNPCNPRALRRAIRRATRFTKLAMKTIHLVHPKKKGRFGGYRKRKRAA